MAAKEKTKPGNNAYPPERVIQTVEACEKLDAECATIMGEARNKCKTRREEIKDIVDDAKSTHGIPKRAIRQVLKIRKLEAKAARARDDQDPDTQDDIDMLRHALGDLAETPLGEAAQR